MGIFVPHNIIMLVSCSQFADRLKPVSEELQPDVHLQIYILKYANC